MLPTNCLFGDYCSLECALAKLPGSVGKGDLVQSVRLPAAGITSSIDSGYHTDVDIATRNPRLNG